MELAKFTLIRFRKIDVPSVIWIVIISTFVAMVGEVSILGYQLTGWAWVIPLGTSIFMILRRPLRVNFPSRIWFPWICLVFVYGINSEMSSLQRSIMLLCPIVVGIAVSTCSIREFQLQGFLKLIELLLFALLIIVIIRTGLLLRGMLPHSTGLAPQSITAALLCTIFAARYPINGKTDLYRWLMGMIIPVIALTRMAIIAAGLTMPLTFASMKIKQRLILFTIIAALGISFFYTERMQSKMFYSGSGTLEDMRLSNPDLFTAGRSRLWDLIREEIRVKPVWGHGANASERFVLSVTWGTLTHPHNDWLRLLYDYGFIGTFIFAFCLVWQVIHLLNRAKRTSGESRILLYAGASSFLPFVLLMFTDNIILYAAFFGNLQFAIVGLVYAAQKTQEVDRWVYCQMSAKAALQKFSPPEQNYCEQQKFQPRA